MHLLADENIPDELIEDLRKAGHDVLTVVSRTADDFFQKVPPEQIDKHLVILEKDGFRIR